MHNDCLTNAIMTAEKNKGYEKNMINRLNVAECLNARFCHDLAGNIGATASGTEFIENPSIDIQKQALHLLKQSSARLTSLLEFYRITFAPHDNNGERAEIETIRNICAEYVENARIKLNFSEVKNGSDICLLRGKIICCLAALASNNLVQGGSIQVNITHNNRGTAIKVIATGNNIRANEEVQSFLTGAHEDFPAISSKNIFAYYARSLTDILGIIIECRATEQQIEYFCA